jgi:hypothetical protein
MQRMLHGMVARERAVVVVMAEVEQVEVGKENKTVS